MSKGSTHSWKTALLEKGAIAVIAVAAFCALIGLADQKRGYDNSQKKSYSLKSAVEGACGLIASAARPPICASTSIRNASYASKAEVVSAGKGRLIASYASLALNDS